LRPVANTPFVRFVQGIRKTKDINKMHQMVVRKQKGLSANIVLVIKPFITVLCSVLIDLLDKLQTVEVDTDVVEGAELVVVEEEAEAVVLLGSSLQPLRLPLLAQLVVVTTPNLGMG
jgi:hypothetical protein